MSDYTDDLNFLKLGKYILENSSLLLKFECLDPNLNPISKKYTLSNSRENLLSSFQDI